MKLLTRKEIIEIWRRQTKDMKAQYCCPSCRDILTKLKDGKFVCDNQSCLMTAEEINDNYEVE